MGKTQKLRNKKINVSWDDVERLGVFFLSLMFFFFVFGFFLFLDGSFFFILGFFVLSSGFLFSSLTVFSRCLRNSCERRSHVGSIGVTSSFFFQFAIFLSAFVVERFRVRRHVCPEFLSLLLLLLLLLLLPGPSSP